MTKRIGVVTLTGGSNYGNKLQHYAVIKYLNKLGYEADTVRDTTRRGFADQGREPVLYEKLSPKYLSEVISSHLQYKYHRKNESDGYLKCILREKRRHNEFAASEKARQQRFDAFTERYLPFGTLTVNAAQRTDESEVKKYGAFVCGSDQVWNPVYRDTSPVRFLSFAPSAKRIALSPSFGVAAIPEERTAIYKKLLSEMAFLSVRESTGQRIIKELTGKDVPVLIDPTLMLTPEEWDEISAKPAGTWDEPYLLTYFLGNKTKAYEKTINSIAKENGLKIINLLEIAESESYLYDPSEFVWLIKNAAFVCTDSFHGTVFSILYHKKFFTFSRSESGFSKDSRVGTLLEKLDLRECAYTGKPYRMPDYSKAEEKLKKEREAFTDYLSDALEKACGTKPPVIKTVVELNEENRTNCTGCSACAQSCPKNAISMQRNTEGFLYPIIDTEKCVNCGKCVAVCASAAKVKAKHPAKAYACVNSCAEQREKSSSGGIFVLLAEKVLDEGGAVFGAAFDGAFQLRHTSADNKAALTAFMGSKYFQSDTADSFSEVRKMLQNGKKVLFSGTPCQIGGLKAYLGKEYENLITVDIICHGTPSQLAFDTYLSEHNDLGKINSVSFRNKEKGWAHFSMKICGENGSYRKDLEHDPFLVAFLHNADLRESCYHCRFKTKERSADITIADMWGVSRILPELDDDKGVSLVLTHSPTGEELLTSAAEKMKLQPVDAERAIKNNSAAIHSVLRPNVRDSFYKAIQTDGFEKTVKKLYPITLKKQIGTLKDKVYRIVCSKRKQKKQ